MVKNLKKEKYIEPFDDDVGGGLHTRLSENTIWLHRDEASRLDSNGVVYDRDNQRRNLSTRRKQSEPRDLAHQDYTRP